MLGIQYLFGYFYFGFIIVAIVLILVFLWRFIKAFERIAGALETIAQKIETVLWHNDNA